MSFHNETTTVSFVAFFIGLKVVKKMSKSISNLKRTIILVIPTIILVFFYKDVIDIYYIAFHTYFL